MNLLVRNGFIYDPLNRISGEKMDIAIRDGKIVEDVKESDAFVIDASGLTVMPGGVDIHSHIAGAEVNAGRHLRPEDHYSDFERKTPMTRSGVGHSVPSTFTTGYRYARMGYTTVMNPSMPPLEARHTHEELNDTPMIDKGSYPLLGDWWFVLEALSNKGKDLEDYVAWMIRATKGYAIKIVNPGGLETWGFGGNVHGLDDQVPNFAISPREILRGLCRVNQVLNLPHTIHVHTNNLGQPGNYATTLDTMESVEDMYCGDKPIIHITHCQFSSFKGENWKTLTSGAEDISRYVNCHSHVTLDMGQVTFTDATTMTADGPFQFGLHTLTGHKWVNHDVETETSAGIVPFQYKRKNYVHSTQWAIGLELALLIRDPWKIFLTTDHPNAGSFTSYPRIMAWLMSRKARNATMRKINNRVRNRCLLSSIERELGFDEITVMTRAGPAKALGLTAKGHLGIGADADIAIYDVNPTATDPSSQYKVVRKAFRRAEYTIKDGEIVVRKGEVVRSIGGRTFWLNIRMPNQTQMNDEMKRCFGKYWTVEPENYPVEESFLNRSCSVEVQPNA